MVASGVYGFKDTNYALFHPAGSLGKKLILKVDDLMAKGDKNAKVHINVPLKDAIIELSKKGLGAVTIVDDEDKVVGIITDGDLRRQLEKGVDVYSLKVEDIMSPTPSIVPKDMLAVEALKILKEKNISCLLVAEDGMASGIIRLQDIIGVGIIG